MEGLSPSHESHATATLPALPATDASVASDAAPPPKKPRWRWALPLVTGVLLLLSVGVGAALLGYRWSNSHHRPTQEVAAVDTAAGDTPDADATEVETIEEPQAKMPDLQGLSHAHALEALADVGVGAENVETTSKPYVGDPDRVIESTPGRGAAVPEEVTLVLSESATVPDLTGQSEADAITTLEALGAMARVTQTYQVGLDAGSVIATSPAAGEAAVESIEVQVSSEPTSVFLSTIDRVSGSCSDGPAATGSLSSDNAMTCSASRSYGSDSPDPTVVYSLNGRVDRFTATAGIDNSGDPDDTARIIVQADGAERFNQVVSFNSPVPIDIELTGAAQLRIFVLPADAETDSYGASVVFIDPTILGSPEAVSELLVQS